MRERGHRVRVVSSFPHYPSGRFEQRVAPYREDVDGVTVVRLPVLIGDRSSRGRILEELTYAVCAAASSPFLASSDVAVAVSPSFLGLWAVGARSRLRRLPWVLWLQDILPDAAATTGLLSHPTLLALARRYEAWAYRASSRIVVISETFAENLATKGADAAKITTIYNPATRSFRSSPRRTAARRRVLTVGNIGLSQGLAEHVRAIEDSGLDAKLVITGTGALEEELRRSIRSDRVQVLGLVDEAALEREFEQASLALVTQQRDVVEFNVPSRLMNYMAEALPVVASVRADSEVARIVSGSGAGWVTSLETVGEVLTAALGDPAELERRSLAALEHARREFDVRVAAERFEELLQEVVAPVTGRRRGPPARAP
jgi:colanic acid biosynthesis glycosyl transferase WcaI